MLAVGAFAERAHLGPLLVFVFLWATLVYDPIACWTWNPNGWSSVHHSYDFAGGTPVHISSGSAGLAISMYLGKRRGYGTEALAYKPQNTTYVVLGTIFLWFGWFGESSELTRLTLGPFINNITKDSTAGLHLLQTSELRLLALSQIWLLALVD